MFLKTFYIKSEIPGSTDLFTNVLVSIIMGRLVLWEPVEVMYNRVVFQFHRITLSFL